MNSVPELHLFIIWSAGRTKEREIVSDLKNNLEVLEVKEVTWAKKLFFKNLCRFYGLNFVPNSTDITGRGIEPFIVVTALDHSPKYEIAQTSSGHSKVNINILQLKKKYRSWITNEFSIHSTVNERETNNNLTMLFGLNKVDYLKELYAKTTDQRNAPYNADVVGAKGWSSLQQLFYVLNSTVPYTLLRDFNANSETLGTESDIDILADDIGMEKFPFILNSSPKPDDVPGTVMFEIVLGARMILIHLHSYSYLTTRWVYDILESRRLNQNNIYVPNEEHQFYSLVFQLNHWKHFIKDKYLPLLKDLYISISQDNNPEHHNFDHYLVKLNEFLAQKMYFPIVTNHVRQNPYEYLPVVQSNVADLGISDLKPFRVDIWKQNYGAKTFTGLLAGKKAFIKYFGTTDIVVKEFKLLTYLKSKYPELFPEVYYYGCLPGRHQFLICEYIDAEILTFELWRTLDIQQREKLLQRFIDIICIFNDEGFIHRDIFPSNILITKNLELYIIDYEFMIDGKEKVIKNAQYPCDELQTLYALGEPYNLGSLTWNDGYSSLKIITELQPDFADKFPKLNEKILEIIDSPDATYKYNIFTKTYLKKKVKLKIASILNKYTPKIRRLAARFNV